MKYFHCEVIVDAGVLLGFVSLLRLEWLMLAVADDVGIARRYFFFDSDAINI